MITPLPNIKGEVALEMRKIEQAKARDSFIKKLASKYPIDVKMPELAAAGKFD